MMYNFKKFDIVVEDRKSLGLYFIPRNFRDVTTKEEIHNTIDYCKKQYNSIQFNTIQYNSI